MNQAPENAAQKVGWRRLSDRGRVRGRGRQEKRDFPRADCGQNREINTERATASQHPLDAAAQSSDAHRAVERQAANRTGWAARGRPANAQIAKDVTAAVPARRRHGGVQADCADIQID